MSLGEFGGVRGSSGDGSIEVWVSAFSLCVKDEAGTTNRHEVTEGSGSVSIRRSSLELSSPCYCVPVLSAPAPPSMMMC